MNPSILGVIGFRVPCMNPSIFGVIRFRVPRMNPSNLGVIGPGFLNQVPTLNPKPGAEHQSQMHPT